MGDLVADPEVVEIHETTCGLGRVVEEREAVAQEMGQGIGHLEELPNGDPLLAIEAVKEPGEVPHF